jgi:hypothetical protein
VTETGLPGGIKALTVWAETGAGAAILAFSFFPSSPISGPRVR